MPKFLVELKFHGIINPEKFSTRTFQVRASDPIEAERKARNKRGALSLGAVSMGSIYQYPDVGQRGGKGD